MTEDVRVSQGNQSANSCNSVCVIQQINHTYLHSHSISLPLSKPFSIFQCEFTARVDKELHGLDWSLKWVLSNCPFLQWLVLLSGGLTQSRDLVSFDMSCNVCAVICFTQHRLISSESYICYHPSLTLLKACRAQLYAGWQTATVH